MSMTWSPTEDAVAFPFHFRKGNQSGVFEWFRPPTESHVQLLKLKLFKSNDPLDSLLLGAISCGRPPPLLGCNVDLTDRVGCKGGWRLVTTGALKCLWTGTSSCNPGYPIKGQETSGVQGGCLVPRVVRKQMNALDDRWDIGIRTAAAGSGGSKTFLLFFSSRSPGVDSFTWWIPTLAGGTCRR